MILLQAGRFGGWSLYLKDGKPMYAYNFLGLQKLQGGRDWKSCWQGMRRSTLNSLTTGLGLAREAPFVNGKKVAERKD